MAAIHKCTYDLRLFLLTFSVLNLYTSHYPYLFFFFFFAVNLYNHTQYVSLYSIRLKTVKRKSEGKVNVSISMTSTVDYRVKCT